ncbi:hypothetical protein [Hyphobacterium sp.]|uniref:hypothetical protein n=1 Tax=Hyphobacterium sp. TaxID=2004662 RepID=UPI003BAD0562
MDLTSILMLAGVSAGLALMIGGAVRLFGSQWLFTMVRRGLGLAIRRRGLMTGLLGGVASAGLATASATGLEPPAFTDAVSWLQVQFEPFATTAQQGESLPD